MTPELPKPLQPWTEALSIMRQEVVDGVGTWLAPLRALVGPLAIPRSTVSGDPDGLSGLTRRGSYERLVTSEWAVALELPDEFLRRALMGEHVFVARAYQEPHGAHSSVALLDVGPMQLGAPRLVQLAALVVLAQRAADCGAEFRFGILQDATCRLLSVDRDGLIAWAQHRSTSLGREHRPDWAETLDEVEVSDRWIVGASGLRDVASELRAGLVAVEEPLELGNRNLEVSVQRPTAPGGHVTLQRPDDDEGVRALRHPVRPPQQTPSGVPYPEAPRGGLGQLLLRGDRLVVRQPDGVLLAHHAPVGPGGRGTAKEVHPTEWTGTPVGLDVYQGRLVSLMVDGSNLVIGGSGLGTGSSGNSVSVGVTLGPVPDPLASWDEHPVALFVTESHRDRLHAWFVVSERHLYEIDFRSPEDGEIRLLDPWICAYARYDGARIVWVSAGQHALLSNVSFGTDAEPPPLPDNVLDDVVLGPWHPGHPWPSFAYRTALDRISAFGMRPGLVEVPIQPDCRLVGLTSRYVDATQHDPIPILQRPTNDRFIKHGQHEPLLTTPGRITGTRWYPSNEVLVWRTQSGHLGVDAIHPHRVRLRLRPEGSTPR